MAMPSRQRVLAGLCVLAISWSNLTPAAEQQSVERIDAQAFTGEPFGVGQLTVRYLPGRGPQLVAGQGVWLSDKSGRVLYPVYSVGHVRTESNARGGVGSITAYFLFRGDKPLELSLDVLDSHQATVVPADEPAKLKSLRNDYWSTHVATVQQQAAEDGYPQQVDNFVTAMLARRMQLPMPAVPRTWSNSFDVDTIFGTLMGAESVRIAMQKETLLATSRESEPANQALPTAALPPAISVPAVPGDVQIEPIARHVPAECFYLRCGSFANFQWLRVTSDTWGGSLRDLVAVRGLDYDIRGRLERQLALRESALSKLLGDTVIADVALIGADTFVREGAALGVLFQARNTQLLNAAIVSQRQLALQENAGCSESTIAIGERRVSLLSTPDNRVRSFHAVDGDFHLVTTSQYVARRFLEAGSGKDALADLKEFRYARSLMPVSRKDTLFVYLSDPWFRLLISPQYRVEMTRRMQAEAEIELVQIARLAARGEKQPDATLAELVAGGFLPAGFGKRPDGSRVVLEIGSATDSLRGARRSFLPVADVVIEKVTATEHNSYADFVRRYLNLWQRVDPVIVGLRREETTIGNERRELLKLDVHITPYAREHYALLAAFLGPPTNEQLAPIAGNALQLELQLRPFGNRREVSHFRAFAGLQDFVPSFAVHEGKVIWSSPGDGIPPVYLGATPLAIDSFLFGKPDELPEGYSEQGDRMMFRWARRFGDFAVISNDRRLLESATSQVKLQRAERPAQLRLQLADLAGTRLVPYLNSQGYTRALATSAGNLSFFHVLMQQLRVDPEQAIESTETVLAARPVCPLGGKYKLHEFGPGPVRWKSTAWPEHSPYIGNVNRVPAEYRFPFLDWMRGLSLELSIDAQTLMTHIEVELQPKPASD